MYMQEKPKKCTCMWTRRQLSHAIPLAQPYGDTISIIGRAQNEYSNCHLIRTSTCIPYYPHDKIY